MGAVVGLALAALALPLPIGCASQNNSAAPPTQTVTPAVLLHPNGAPTPIKVAVELAKTNEERARGLMFRDKLLPNTGMLFLFDREEPRAFWMKNTYVSLDMIFITAAKKVLGIVERTEPLSTTPRSVPGASKYVLEVPAGFAKANGIVANTQVEFMHVE